MAVWVRILGLPFRYFKDFTIDKIGCLLGSMVKVDKVTLAQSRGKFARLCVEIDLQKPLRPFIEVEGKAYGVVYEGISMICFNYGCYGHVKASCPYVKNDDDPTSLDSVPNATFDNRKTTQMPNTMAPATYNESTFSTSSEMQVVMQKTAPTKTKNDNGPWMLMSYKTRQKPPNASLNNKQNSASGSRFELLQSCSDGIDEFTQVNSTVSPSSLSTQSQTILAKPPKIWKKVQDKTMQASSSKSNDAHGIDAFPHGPSKVKPLQDITNDTVQSSRVQLKNSTAISHHPKLQAHKLKNSMVQAGAKVYVFSDLNSLLSNNKYPSSNVNASAAFGHCPLELVRTSINIMQVYTSTSSSTCNDQIISKFVDKVV
ncbi:uncharacterized protein LOC112194246 [Rosa chinensis]|uniref:uncharacterized protein LOC112194246 n=1 Tax=Rosa chinensis TaxID=74649 RepID=UPI000D0881C2|nr:uncharacterized protein LOC112194246 [Rosa chinensis]